MVWLRPYLLPAIEPLNQVPLGVVGRPGTLRKSLAGGGGRESRDGAKDLPLELLEWRFRLRADMMDPPPLTKVLKSNLDLTEFGEN